MRALLISLALILGAQGNTLDGKVGEAPQGYEQWVSPLYLPAQDTKGTGSWTDAVSQARDLVDQLTVEELVNITSGADKGEGCVGNSGQIPRLGIRSVCYGDGPNGLRGTDGVSVFPGGISAATTWDKDLIYERGVAIGQEFRDKGTNVYLGPQMNLVRLPAAGRNWETFGADPFLSGVASAQTIKGVQSSGVIATAKHFLGNEVEHYRGSAGAVVGTSSSNIPDRTMRELYLWPFVESVKADVGAVLCGYNRVNQTQVCENSFLLNRILKKELGFQGFVTSDWWAIFSGMAPILAGLDTDMPGSMYWDSPTSDNPLESTHSFGSKLLEGAKNGTISSNRLKDMATRIFASVIKMGQYKNGFPEANYDVNHDNSPRDKHLNVQGGHAQTIRKMAADSAVLLKNTGILPLKDQTLSVFGNDAGPPPYDLNDGQRCGIYHGCDDGTLGQGWGSGTTNYAYLSTPIDAIRRRSPATVQDHLSGAIDGDLVSKATASQVALVFVNADSGEGFVTVDGNAGDRNNLTLWLNGDALIQNVAEHNENVVVVIHAVGPVIVEDWINHGSIKAVIHAHTPGEEAGSAITDVLFGDVNPSGKLVYTIAKDINDYPAQLVYNDPSPVPQIIYEEGLFIDHRWFDEKNIEPRFPFGFGLSYSKFVYTSVALQTNKRRVFSSDGSSTPTTYIRQRGRLFDTMDPEMDDEVVRVKVSVRNDGPFDGAEVVQVYITFPNSAEEPPLVLRGFEKLPIKKGHSASTTISLTRRHFSIWDVQRQQWRVPHGVFKVNVGASSRDIKASKKLAIA